MTGVNSRGRVPTWLVIVLAVGGGFALCIGLLVAALIVPAVLQASQASKQAEAQRLIDQLASAARSYELEYGLFPSGDGTDSKALARVLSQSRAGKPPFFEFRTGMLDDRGNVRNPIDPAREILTYRNNMLSYPENRSDPTVHNKSSFDIWGRNARGVRDGVNNWE